MLRPMNDGNRGPGSGQPVLSALWPGKADAHQIGWLSRCLALGLLLLLSVALCPGVHADTPVSGDITTAVHWTLAGSPYIVTGDLYVRPGGTLTIDSGVQVRVAPRMWIRVQGGSLVAGGVGSPVVFTAQQSVPPDSNRWYYVSVESGSARLTHCVIEYAGYANTTGGLIIATSDVQVRDTVVRYSGASGGGSAGVRLQGKGITPLLENVTITSNAGMAVYQDTVNMNPTYHNLTMSGNSRDAVFLPGDTLDRNVTLDSTGFNGRPYFLDYDLHVPLATALTVQPGTTLAADSSVWIRVQGGSLYAQGTAALPITFTSAAATPAPGQWYYVSIESGSARLTHCVIEYAGYNNDTAGLIIATSDVQVRDSVVRYNGVSSGGSAGIRLRGAGITPLLENLTISSNAGMAVYQETVNMNPTYHNLTMSGNSGDVVYLSGGTLDRNVTLDSTGFNTRPYLLGSDLVVPLSTTLTVQPGTTLGVAGNMWIRAQGGTLLAEGTASAPITFTAAQVSPSLARWRFLGVDSGAARLSHCLLEYAGYSGGEAGLIIASSDVQVRDTVIRNNGVSGYSASDGIRLRNKGITPLLENLTISSNAGMAVRQETVNMNPTYHNLTFSGNGHDVVWLPSDTLDRNVTLDGTGLRGRPFWLDWDLYVPQSTTLTLQPGTTLAVDVDSVWVVVRQGGALLAEGTATQPITFTSTAATPAPGQWSMIDLQAGSKGRLGHCDINSAGLAGYAALRVTSSDVQVHACRIHGNQYEGIRVEGDASPSLTSNLIYDNGFGVRNTSTRVFVDARFSYWGHPSGPQHPTTNPTGQGNAVSDRVLYVPWAVDEAGTLSGGAGVQILGPGRASPGDTVEYALVYTNQLTRTLQDAVIVFYLPRTVEYLDNTGGGVYWPQRHQVFWRLGNMAPGAEGALSVRARFFWRLREGMRSPAMARLGSANWGGWDTSPYLAYAPVLVTGDTTLTRAEFDAERTTYPALQTLYGQAVAEGYLYGGARRYTLSGGAPVMEAVFLKLEQGAVLFLRRQDSRVMASRVDSAIYALRDTTGGLTRTLQTGDVQYWGQWRPAVGNAPQGIGYLDCLNNCVLEKVPGWIAGKIPGLDVLQTGADCLACANPNTPSDERAAACTKCGSSFQKKVPFVGEGVDVLKCGAECAGDPNKYLCTKDIVVPDDSWYNLFAWLGVPSCKKLSCANGRYAGVGFITCAFGQVCVAGEGCRDCATQSTTTAGCSSCNDTQVRLAKDPNAKYGPSGDVLPGQLLTYTITYENEGQGTAFGVYITDTLSEHLDESTLTITGGGQRIGSSRTIYWEVPDLAPKETGAVTFTVRVKQSAPAGTPIVNQAVVYFPSVPEETPTNSVVNVVQPLLALAQRLETNYAQPVAVTLQGSDPSHGALSYAVVAQPLYGQLTGSAPNLTYTPPAGYAGEDSFQFTVSNGSSTSRPAEVKIVVKPIGDATPPQVLWADPANGAQEVTLSARPVLTDAQGPAYGSLAVGFSEALDPSTVTTSTVTLTDSSGARIASVVSYDPFTHRVVVLSRVPWQAGKEYRLTITPGVRGVKDLASNPLVAEYRLSFATAGGVLPPQNVTIAGPTRGVVNEPYDFVALVTPISVTEPLTYTWSLEPRAGQGTDQVRYMWDTAGSRTITVTVANAGGTVTGTHRIIIELHTLDLPLVLKNR